MFLYSPTASNNAKGKRNEYRHTYSAYVGSKFVKISRYAGNAIKSPTVRYLYRPYNVQPHCTQPTHPINGHIRNYLSYRMSNCGNITFINGTRSGYVASSHTGRQSELVFLVHSARSSSFTKLDSFSLAFYFVAMAFVRSGWHVLAC